MNTAFEIHHVTDGVQLRYAKGRSLRSGREIHPFHELLLYLDGGGRCYTEHFDTELRPHTLFVIPAGTYHRFDVKDQASYTRITLTFEPTEHTEDVALLSHRRVHMLDAAGGELASLLGTVRDALSSPLPPRSRERRLRGAFYLLLAALETAGAAPEAGAAEEGRAMLMRCTEHIDRHLSEALHTEALARAMHVSVATLHHRFKRYLGISPHAYVLQKRMADAHLRILHGEPPTQVACHVGYADYATFYKVYRRHFGYTPSETVRRRGTGPT